MKELYDYSKKQHTPQQVIDDIGSHKAVNDLYTKFMVFAASPQGK